MCNAYNLKIGMTAIGDALHRQLGLNLTLLAGGTNVTPDSPIPEAVYPHCDGLILRPVGALEPVCGLEPALAHWNLTPYFHDGPLKAWRARMHTVRSEIMATQDPFRDPYRRRRCIVPATSFTVHSGPIGARTIHAIKRADGGLLFMAGFWERSLTDDGLADSYTMPTIEAVKGDDIAPFHNRQPIILDGPGAALWLDLRADPASALVATPPGTLVADRQATIATVPKVDQAPSDRRGL
jgi:putative SOS response-associated peptidase YedK